MQPLRRTEDASGSLVDDFRRAMDEGTRALKQQLAALNKGRAAVGMPPLRIVEEKRVA